MNPTFELPGHSSQPELKLHGATGASLMSSWRFWPRPLTDSRHSRLSTVLTGILLLSTPSQRGTGQAASTLQVSLFLERLSFVERGSLICGKPRMFPLSRRRDKSGVKRNMVSWHSWHGRKVKSCKLSCDSRTLSLSFCGCNFNRG